MPTLSRRHPAAIALLLLLGLFVTGTAYSAVAPKEATASVASADSVANGKKLFVANCATCHGANGLGIDQAGPSLAGVGAASVDFQMGTGRMPMTEPGVQAKDDLQVKFTDEEISDIAAYVATLGPGPSVPDEEYTDGSKGDPGKGGQIFRVNCAMCHNSAGAGGALTRGKDAPSVQGVSGKHIYERPWRPARRACPSSTTPTSARRASATSSPTSRRSRRPATPEATLWAAWAPSPRDSSFGPSAWASSWASPSGSARSPPDH